TSNRPDCLGHLGVAREISVLFDQSLNVKVPQPKTDTKKTSEITSVEIDCEELCPRYIARVIRGVKIGPSPDWLIKRLETLGIAAINNLVDITNYVLMECGQPLHAFDFDKLHGKQIIVRHAKPGEKIVAIDQREYELDPKMCVIADADHPVAIGGVMGGLETEISSKTVNVLIETADFAPLSIRTTARKLNLHSPSSFRFERGVDASQLDWASRRCCELILELAGGELCDEAIYAGSPPESEPPSIALRFNQIPRILGIEIPQSEAVGILQSLGLEQQQGVSNGTAYFVPPSWRRDLNREADLIEEVARIYGYDKIPDDVVVPLDLSSVTLRDRVTQRVRDVLTAAGCYEAVTLSFVSEETCRLFPPRNKTPYLKVDHSSRRQENILRQSLIPSLLVSRRENERHGTFNAQLFEIAKVYLEANPGRPEQQVEPTRIGLVSGRSFGELKGLIEGLADGVNHDATFETDPCDAPQFVEGRGAEVLLNGKFWGRLGELKRSVSDQLDLRDAVTVAELDLAILEESAQLTPQYTLLPQYPSVDRDLNFVLDESTTWKQLEEVVRASAGELLESVVFSGQYRGKQIAAGKKSYVATLGYRSAERTLTNEEIESIQNRVVEACHKKLGAELRAS
ncbi:MAG: phenylalanine--tRNA ligase subunit beta, partial [Planctomycetes bacterium]|nr:phenylalanine--tRNA ligase subunit beta [Planctomycetota bacterium]